MTKAIYSKTHYKAGYENALKVLATFAPMLVALTLLGD